LKLVSSVSKDYLLINYGNDNIFSRQVFGRGARGVSSVL
jgi:hypothetical protein